MSWFDHQESLNMNEDNQQQRQDNQGPKCVMVKLPGGTDFLPINKNTCERIYEDEIGKPILIIVDEAAELLNPEAGSSQEVKEENSMKNECEAIMKSITALGRSASVHMLVATQRNDTKTISGQMQNNCLKVNTKVLTY